ncbi:MAG: multiheme c-type cytochrome [Myxococcota bacterium]
MIVWLCIAVVLSFAGEALPATAQDCGGCHPGQYQQWRTSRHSKSATNAIFRTSWERRPDGWCLSCHAPRPEQQVDLLGHLARPGIPQRVLEDPPGQAWKDGVDCLACHRDGDRLRTATPPSATAQAMHPIAQDPTFGTELACSGCHEFAFQNHTPALPFTQGPNLTQSTVTEWRTSRAFQRGQVCQDCHMGEHGHGMPGGHSPAFVRAALSVQATRQGSDLRVQITPTSVGHAVPTGDPFRRLELHMCVDSACAEPRIAQLAHRSVRRTDTTWTIHRDDRVPVDEALVWAVPIETAQEWRLVYRYGERTLEAGLAPFDVGYAVASGLIPTETP